MNNVTVVDNPYVASALSELRDRDTKRTAFRHFSDQLCQILLSESLRGLPQKKTIIQTPVTDTEVERLQVEDIVIVPILRAGIAMLPAAFTLLPKAKVGFVGLERDEETAEAREYYYKMPEITENSTVIIVDPMLATGGSIVHVLERLTKTPAKEIRIVCVISAPEGIEKVHGKFPNIKIFTAVVDDLLNDKKYIVPGLGDYGDRYFGTEA